MTLNTSRRNVIATSGPDKYLVSFAVTTDAATAVADGPATDAIINGFRVTAPGAAALSGPAPVAATPAPGPGRDARAAAGRDIADGRAGAGPTTAAQPSGGIGARAAAAAQPAPEPAGVRALILAPVGAAC